MKRTILIATLLALLAACASQPPSTTASVAETIARDPNLSTLDALVVKAGLTDTLKAAGPYTVFAPTNAAFKTVPAKTMDALAQDPEMLKAVLAYHVVPGKVLAAEVKNSKAKTTEGASLSLVRAGDFVTVDEAMVETADIMASNGVVHSVDRVLMPPKKKK